MYNPKWLVTDTSSSFCNSTGYILHAAIQTAKVVFDIRFGVFRFLESFDFKIVIRVFCSHISRILCLYVMLCFISVFFFIRSFALLHSNAVWYGPLYSWNSNWGNIIWFKRIIYVCIPQLFSLGTPFAVNLCHFNETLFCPCVRSFVHSFSFFLPVAFLCVRSCSFSFSISSISSSIRFQCALLSHSYSHFRSISLLFLYRYLYKVMAFDEKNSSIHFTSKDIAKRMAVSFDGFGCVRTPNLYVYTIMYIILFKSYSNGIESGRVFVC